MAKKKQNIPAYGTAEINGVTYFRTRITDADGKRVPLYASTCEELYRKEQKARQQVQDILFRRQNPTVEDYCEKWLLMRSATVTLHSLCDALKHGGFPNLSWTGNKDRTKHFGKGIDRGLCVPFDILHKASPFG